MMFKNLHTKNSGEDCCYLGRQIQMLMEKMMAEKGYKTIAGDTDSIFLKHKDGKIPYEKIRADLNEVVAFMKAHIPFPLDTFDIGVEAIINYIMFVSDEDESKKLKKNYVYIKHKVNGPPQVVIMGLPIKKANATELGPLIFKKYIEPRMIAENKGKFEKDWIVSLVKKELKENMELIAQEYNFNRFEMYSEAGKKSLPAQISKAYMNGMSGKLKLIKNKRVGKAGSNFRYCSLEEAKQAYLVINDLDLTKVYNELSPFCVEVLDAKSINKPRAFFNNLISSTSSYKLEPLIKTKGFFQ
jgi:DNA polymerase elongation subunit (family B)